MQRNVNLQYFAISMDTQGERTYSCMVAILQEALNCHASSRLFCQQSIRSSFTQIAASVTKNRKKPLHAWPCLTSTNRILAFTLSSQLFVATTRVPSQSTIWAQTTWYRQVLIFADPWSFTNRYQYHRPPQITSCQTFKRSSTTTSKWTNCYTNRKETRTSQIWNFMRRNWTVLRRMGYQ